MLYFFVFPWSLLSGWFSLVALRERNPCKEMMKRETIFRWYNSKWQNKTELSGVRSDGMKLKVDLIYTVRFTRVGSHSRIIAEHTFWQGSGWSKRAQIVQNAIDSLTPLSALILLLPSPFPHFNSFHLLKWIALKFKCYRLFLINIKWQTYRVRWICSMNFSRLVHSLSHLRRVTLRAKGTAEIEAIE